MKVKIKFKDLYDLYFKPGEEIIIDAEPIEEEWPRHNDEYYFCTISSQHLYVYAIWYGNEHELHRKSHNLIFRTKEEAIARSKEILEMIKEKT